MAGGYQPRLAAGGTAPLPMGSGEAFGAGVGAAVSNLGGSLENLALVERQVKRNEEYASAGLGLQQALAATGQYERDDQDGKTEGWQPRGAGHQARVLGTYDRQAGAILDGVSDPKMRIALQERIQANRNAIADRTDNFEATQRLQGFAQDSQGMVAAVSSRLGQTDDPNDIANALDDLHASFKGMDAPPAAREAALDNAERQANHGFLLGQADRNPDRVAALIQSGHFDNLGAPALTAVQNSADAEIRRRAAVQAHQVELVRHDVTQQVEGVNARLEAGIVVPDSELQTASNAARSVGEDVAGFKLEVARVHANINKETTAWTPGQWDANISALRAKGKRSPDEDVRLHWLESRAPAAKEEFANHPDVWAAASGDPAPALNFGDPASLAARARWQARTSAVAHQPMPFLGAAEVQQLQAAAADSPKGKFDVIDTVANIGAVDRHEAQRAIGQVLPDDKQAPWLVLLAPQNRQAAFNGAQVRNADKTLIDGAGPNAAGAAALAKYRHDVEPALALWGPDAANAAYEVAGNMYADWAHRTGVHAFNPDQFGMFLHVAVGARRDASGSLHGGIGYWNDKPVHLPPSQNQAQFETVMSRMTWKPDWSRAPVFHNGTPMTPDDIRKLTPVQRPDGRYEFHGDNDVRATDRANHVFTLGFEDVGKRMHLP